jgi:hypothetical protein
MLGLQPVEGTIERADGNSPFSTLLDLMPNGNAIGVVTQPDHRQQDDLFKFAERVSGAHSIDLQSRINSRAFARKDHSVDGPGRCTPFQACAALAAPEVAFCSFVALTQVAGAYGFLDRRI